MRLNITITMSRLGALMFSCRQISVVYKGIGKTMVSINATEDNIYIFCAYHDNIGFWFDGPHWRTYLLRMS